MSCKHDKLYFDMVTALLCVGETNSCPYTETEDEDPVSGYIEQSSFEKSEAIQQLHKNLSHVSFTESQK